MKNFNRSTAREHVNKTVPRRVTKQSQMEKLKNTNLDAMSKDIDDRLKDVLVALAGTGSVEAFGINLINQFRKKMSKRISKEQQRRSSAKGN